MFLLQVGMAPFTLENLTNSKFTMGEPLYNSHYIQLCIPYAVHADSLGNVTLVGYRYTSPTEGRAANALLAIKYDASGTMLWENIIEGDFSPWNNSLFRTNVSSVADPADNVFIASAGNVSGYPTTGFNVIKVNPEGVIEWVSTKIFQGFLIILFPEFA